MSRQRLIALVLAFALVWMGTLGCRKLVTPDEGRYAEISREMALSGDWVTPRLNGIKYFEKPPLQYWATAAAFEAFGETEFAARLWTGLAGLLAVLATFFTGRRLFGAQAGPIAAAVCASSLLFVFMGHFNALDMGLAGMLHLAVCGFLLAQQGSAQEGRRWMLAAWAALALAVLAKGIVALVLTGGALVLYSLATRDFSPWKRLAPVSGTLLFLAVAAPWFVAVSAANPEFARFFFIHEHFERFLTKTHGRVEPAWYFLPVLAVGFLPWTGAVLHAVVPASWRREGEGFQPRRFLLLWCLVVLGFFSASGSKLPSYILPMLPALALLAGDALPRLSSRALRGHVAVLAVLASAALVLAPRAAGLGEEIPGAMAAYAKWLTASAAVLLAATLAALWLAVRERRAGALLLVAGGAFLAGTGALLGHDSLSRTQSAYHIALEIKPLLRPGTPFYSVNMHDQTLPFYLGRTVTLVEYRDEFDFGLRQEPQHAVPTIAEFRQRWFADADAFAIMRPNLYAGFAADPAFELVARDPRRVVVRKRRPS